MYRLLTQYEILHSSTDLIFLFNMIFATYIENFPNTVKLSF